MLCSFHRSMIFFLLLIIQSVSIRALASSSTPDSLSLQSPHVAHSPADTVRMLADECEKREITLFDVYGDYDKSPESSWLRRFEGIVAQDFNKPDAVFMPSGVMAQSIALLIHQRKKNEQTPSPSPSRFICHSSSHLLLHENEAYRELLHMEPIVVSTPVDGCSCAPMCLDDVRRALEERSSEKESIHTLILELPHRELGGKCTPYQDVLKMRELCNSHDIRFHCDGARIFEATAAYDKSMAELAAPFDTVYISFYKGLAGLSGAMLLGSHQFCEEARVWLRRFGGNLYTLLPYAVSGWSGYDKFWKEHGRNRRQLSFMEKRDKLRRIVSQLQGDPSIGRCVTFDPLTPEVNMVHGYLRETNETCMSALDRVESLTGIRVLVRVREVSQLDPAFDLGYRSKFEWVIGEANGRIPDDKFLQGWKVLAAELLVMGRAKREI